MAYRPKHQSQLGRGPCPNDGKTDCNVRAHQMVVDWATDGNWVPGIKKLREEMGRPCNDPTNLHNAQAAMKAMGVPVNKNINQPWWHVIRALKNGKPVVFSMKYDVLTRKQPYKSGDPNFAGGHGIMLLGTRLRGDGKRIVLSWDSLYDGRRKSIPKGPQWVLASTMKAAAQAFARTWGGGSGNDAWFNIMGKKRKSRTLRPLNQQLTPRQEAFDDETELDIHEVEVERNDLVIAAADVEFYDLIIENPKVPKELRLEAEAKRATARALLPYPLVDPYLAAEDGIDTDEADPDPSGSGAPNVALSEADVDDIIAEAEASEDDDEAQSEEED